MTAGRAALLTAVGSYFRLSQLEQAITLEGASLLEIQKLMYFLQEAGQPLRLKYVKARGHTPTTSITSCRHSSGYCRLRNNCRAEQPVPGAFNNQQAVFPCHPDRQG
ncbi:MAG: hypothetical protein ACRDOH_22555 [Streptosporangiaceae bacterium]